MTSKKIFTSNHKHTQFDEEREKNWDGPFYFIQGADIQFGFIASFIEGNKTPSWEKEKELAKLCVEKINALNPKPKFFVVCGDLVNAMPDSDLETREEQEKSFHEIFSKIDSSIPLVCVCGNHDVGNYPTMETVMKYRSSFGDDYFSFWVGGVLFLVVNSQYYFDSTEVEKIFEEQSKWLDEQLEISKASRHGAVIFQHIPWFIDDPEKEETYFAIQLRVRKPMLEKLHKAGVKYIFCGHLHRNSGGFYKDMENIITAAMGGQIGDDISGVRVVKVLENVITHIYYGYEDLPAQIKFK